MPPVKPESVFRLLFAALFAGAVLVRVAHQRLAGNYRGGVAHHAADHVRHEARGLLLLRGLFGLPWYAMVMAWLFRPSSIAWSQPPVSPWARGAGGLALGIAGLALLAWGHRALGRNFSPTLALHADHELVTAGPYAWIRHPLYLAFVLLLAGAGVLTGSAVILALGLGLIATVVAVRVPQEERLLAEAFGERYRDYERRTPRFLVSGRRR